MQSEREDMPVFLDHDNGHIYTWIDVIELNQKLIQTVRLSKPSSVSTIIFLQYLKNWILSFNPRHKGILHAHSPAYVRCMNLAWFSLYVQRWKNMNRRENIYWHKSKNLSQHIQRQRDAFWLKAKQISLNLKTTFVHY